ncbi:SGNH/GDSL hydrolase family protein [Nocardia sp. NPDC050713]|uniref:SGNH/GDSL hydrolase family protein n=1 Tax=Nocardia sp. NPDC050713 TaxID=3154511 RepID=UPI00340F533B
MVSREGLDVTCSGATTANILDEPQRLPVGPVMPPQIGAVTPDTELVTITVGGNDLGLIGGMIARSCGPGLVGALPAVSFLASELCASVLGDSAEPTAADFERVQGSIADVVRAVQSKAPNATVLLVEYLPVVDRDGTVCTKVPLSQSDAKAARRAYEGLVAASRAAALETGATTVAAPNADDHHACAATPWTYGFNSPLDSDAPDVGLIATIASSYHPNGHERHRRPSRPHCVNSPTTIRLRSIGKWIRRSGSSVAVAPFPPARPVDPPFTAAVSGNVGGTDGEVCDLTAVVRQPEHVDGQPVRIVGGHRFPLRAFE